MSRCCAWGRLRKHLQREYRQSMDPVVCVKPGIDQVTLHVTPVGALKAPPWTVEKLDGRNWWGSMCWTLVPDVRCTKVETSGDKAPLYRLDVGKLSAETEYQFRIVSPDGGETQRICRTVGRPAVPNLPECVQRGPSYLVVEWLVASIDNVVPTECLLQYRPDSMFTTWLELNLNKNHQVERDKSDEWTRWQARLNCLQGATDYVIRARSRNSVGWSREFSDEGRIRTSELPSSPYNMRVVARRHQGVSIELECKDTDGAPTRSIEVEAWGTVRWYSHEDLQQVVLKQQEQEQPGSARTYRVDIGNLVAEVDASLRFWARNSVGRSTLPSDVIVCRPSDRPAAVWNLECIIRSANAIEVQWCAKDPDGAPVEECAVQYGRCNHLFGSFYTAPSQNVERLPEKRKSLSGRSRWKARIEGLEGEAGYLIRACARNQVGWAYDPGLSLECRTADRPPKPQALRCVARTLTSVTLEFDIACDRAQSNCMEPVTCVAVERAGVLMWQAIQDADVLPVPDVEVSKSTRLYAGHVRRGVVVGGLQCGTWYSFRIWVANAIGWNLEMPPVIDCHTATRPEAPSELRAVACGPHAVSLLWCVGDPEGSPVLDCDVQVRENSVFSMWRDTSGSDTLRRLKVDGPRWEQLVDGLKTGVEHVVRVRARNDVEWSDWSAELQCEAILAPTMQWVMAQRTAAPSVGEPAAGRNGDTADNDGSSIILDCGVKESPCAPALFCVVTHHATGRQVLGARISSGSLVSSHWLARLGGAAKGKRFIARAAGATGWGEAAETTTVVVDNEAGDVFREQVGEDKALPLTTATVAWVAAELDRQREAQCSLASLLHEAEERGDTLRAGKLKSRIEVVESAGSMLDGVLSLGQVEGPEFMSWPKRCRTSLDQQVGVGGLGASVTKDGAQNGLAAVRVLVEAGIWLERMGLERLNPLWSTICAHVEAAPQARVIQMWVQHWKAWSDRFNRQLLAIWLEGFVTALRLLAAVVGHGDLAVAAARLHLDCTAFLALRDAADQQLRKLRRTVKLLVAIDASGASGASAPQSFDQVSVLDKVSQTALGLLLTAVLPIPGSIEVGVVNIGMLWLEHDAAGRHMAVEHPRRDGPEAPHRRFRQWPRPHSVRLLREWTDGMRDTFTLVHNATARLLTVRLLDSEGSLWRGAYTRIQQAHPFVRVVTAAVEMGFGAAGGSAVAGGNTDPSVMVVEPTCVIAMPVPDDDGRRFDLEFAYGAGSYVERAIGRTPAKLGCAFSFVCLDHEVHINNQTVLCEGTVEPGDYAGFEDWERPGGWSPRQASWQHALPVGALVEGPCDPAGRDLGAPPAASSSASPADLSFWTSPYMSPTSLAVCSSPQVGLDDGTSVAGDVAVATGAAVGPPHSTDVVMDAYEGTSPSMMGGRSTSREPRIAGTSEDGAQHAITPADAVLVGTEGVDDTGHEPDSCGAAVGDGEGASTSTDALPVAAEEGQRDDMTVEVVNHDFAPVTVRFFAGARAIGHIFEQPLLAETVEAGARKTLVVPPAAVPGTSSAAVATTAVGHRESDDWEGFIVAPFEAEVQSSTKKTLCNVRSGQVLTFEGVL